MNFNRPLPLFHMKQENKIRREHSTHYKADNLEENTDKCRKWLFRIYWNEIARKWKTWNYGMQENMEEYLQWHICRLGKETYWEENKYSEMKLKFNWEVIKNGDTWQRFYTIMSKTFNKPNYDHICGLINFSTPGMSVIKVNLIVQCLEPRTVKEREWNNNMNTWQ